MPRCNERLESQVGLCPGAGARPGGPGRGDRLWGDCLQPSAATGEPGLKVREETCRGSQDVTRQSRRKTPGARGAHSSRKPGRASLRKHRRGSPRLTRERWADYWRDKETGTQALRGGQGGGGPAHSALCYTST